jgi:glycosyltransferase involved in cell wall biosynthesis
MKILMVTPFFPPSIGGIEHQVWNISNVLEQRGHKVTVLTSLIPECNDQCYNQMKSQLQIIRIKTLFLPSWPYQSLLHFGLNPFITSYLNSLFKKQCFDIIHVHGHHYPLTWLTVRFALKKKIPVVLTLHGMYALNPLDPVAKYIEEIFNRTVFKRLLIQATMVTCPSNIIIEYARKYLIQPEKFTIVPNGVDIEKFKVAKSNIDFYRRKYSIPEDGIVLLFVGRFVESKGVSMLARVAKYIAKKYPDTYFLFVGEGPLRSVVEAKLKQDNLCYRSKVIGGLPYSKIHEIYAISDIFILPTKWEGLPMTLLEAIASGLFIVATDVGGISDVLKTYHKSVVIKGDIDQDLIEAIDYSIHRYLKSKRGKTEVTQKFIENFSWSNVVDKFEEVYAKVYSRRVTGGLS